MEVIWMRQAQEVFKILGYWAGTAENKNGKSKYEIIYIKIKTLPNNLDVMVHIYNISIQEAQTRGWQAVGSLDTYYVCLKIWNKTIHWNKLVKQLWFWEKKPSSTDEYV